MRSMVVFRLAVFCLGVVSCTAYNHTQTCFMNDTQVLWNITFTGTQAPNIMEDKRIVMQTKNYHGETWRSLINCERGTHWLQCPIDKSPIRWKYHMRIVELSTNATSTAISKVLVKEEKEGHFQDGLLCWHNHYPGEDFVYNGAITNVSADSATVRLTFYEWDIYKFYLLYLRIYVRDGTGTLYTELHITIEDDTPLNYTRSIKGLKSCTSYTVELLGHYTLHLDQTVQLPFRTSCPYNSRKGESWTMSDWMGALMVALCVIVIGIAITYIYIRQRKEMVNPNRLGSTDDEADDVLVKVVYGKDNELIKNST